MTGQLAVVWLYEMVRDRFATETPEGAEAIEFAFGEDEVAKHFGKRRIIFVPGDDGDLGSLSPASYPGRNPRSLGTLDELVTVYLEGIDLTDVNNQILQYSASRRLFDGLWRAVYHAAANTVSMRSLRVVDNKIVRRLGSTLRVVLDVEAMIPDVPVPTVTVTAVETETTLLDVSVTDSTEDAP